MSDSRNTLVYGTAASSISHHTSTIFLALGFAESRLHLGIDCKHGLRLCSRFALPLLLDCVYTILGEKTI